MKTRKDLTDYYVEVTEKTIDLINSYLGVAITRNSIGMYLMFRYDDVNSAMISKSNPLYKIKLKWSEMKRFIENSPTREKHISQQNAIKGHKLQYSKLKEENERLLKQLSEPKCDKFKDMKIEQLEYNVTYWKEQSKEYQKLYNNQVAECLNIDKKNSELLSNSVKQDLEIFEISSENINLMKLNRILVLVSVLLLVGLLYSFVCYGS